MTLGPGRLVAHRARARASALVVLAVLVATVAGVCGVTLAHTRASATATVRDVVAAAGPDGGGLVVRTRLADDAAGQQAAFEAVLSERFGEVPLEVTRSLTDPSSGARTPDDVRSQETLDVPFVWWSVRPRPDRVEPHHLETLVSGARALDLALTRADGVTVRGVTVEGDLGTTAARASEAAGVTRGLGLVPVVLLVVVALMTLVLVVRLLVRSRDAEVSLLLARGGEPWRVGSWAAVEGTVVALLGGVVGGAAAAVVPVEDEPQSITVVLLAAGAVVGLAVLVVAAVAARRTNELARVDEAGRADRSGRVRTVTAAGTVVLVLAAAVLTVWRLLRQDARYALDPLATAAPAAALLAVAVLALLVLGPAARVAAHVAGRGRRLTPALVARQVARRPGEVAVPVVLLVLGAGTVAVAATYAGTAAVHRADVAAVRAGADVRVVLPAGATSGGGTDTVPAPTPYAAIEGVGTAVAVVHEPVVVGERAAVLTALPAERGGDVLVDAGRPDAAALARLAVPAAGVELPRGTQVLELDVRVAAPSGSTSERTGRLSLSLWVTDPDGALRRLDAVPVEPGPDPVAVAADLPGPGPHRWVGLDLSGPAAPASGGQTEVEVTQVRRVAPSGEVEVVPLPTEPWVLAGRATSGVVDVETRGPLGFRATASPSEERSGPARPVLVRLVPQEVHAVPALVSRSLGERADLVPGDELAVTFAGPDLVVRVVGVVDTVPGSLEPDALLTDLGTLGRHLLTGREAAVAPTEVWLGLSELPGPRGGGGAEAVAAAARAAVGPHGTVLTSAPASVDPVAPVAEALWLVAAGTVVLTVTGAAAAALAGNRRGEVVVLRALGRPAGAQARARAAEVLGTGLVAILLGLLGGGATAVALVPVLARASSTVGSMLPVEPAVAAVPGAVLVLALGAGVALVASAVAVQVRRQALDAEYREAVR